MCEKCVELDGKIEHYQRMASRMTDQAMLDGIKELIEQMKALKAALGRLSRRFWKTGSSRRICCP
jgi:beta-phosphoglucomutase-like phosphatase (HAD superfamily)